MENPSDRRDKAIKAFNDRTDAANQKAAERQAGIRAQEERRQKLYEDWPRIADGPIANTVTAVNDDFAQHGSPILLAPAVTTAAALPLNVSLIKVCRRKWSLSRVLTIYDTRGNRRQLHGCNSRLIFQPGKLAPQAR